MINNNARQALSDLLTYHKIKTVDGYERKLLAAINSADSLNIKDVQTFTKYALIFYKKVVKIIAFYLYLSVFYH